METSPAAASHSRAEGLRREDLAACPFTQLERWLDDAIAHRLPDPAVMVLATLGADGQLDQRAIVLRHVDPRGLVFFAVDASKKIADLEAHPQVSAYFPWYAMDRQVRLSGHVERIPAAETNRYLVTPPENRAMQPVAWDQAAGAGGCSRAFLTQQFATMRSKFYGGGHWSGYRIVPERVEFWQGGGPRRRDRFVYIADKAGVVDSESGWRIEAIAD